MTITNFIQNRFVKGSGQLKDHSVLEVKGPDSTPFLHGQLTNNVKDLESQHFQLNARLDRQGRVRSFLYLLKESEDHLIIIVPREWASSLKEDLEKYIIMEEVEICEVEKHAFFQLDARADLNHKSGQNYLGYPFGEKGLISFNPFPKAKILKSEDLERICVINGFPQINVNIFGGELVNNTRLNDFAVDYKKGCFLGQETAAKIQTNRDVTYFPALLVTKNSFDGDQLTVQGRKVASIFRSLVFEDIYYFEISLHRDYRIDKLELKGDQLQGQVFTYPLQGSDSLEEKARELFYKATSIFNEGKEHEALCLLEDALHLYPLPDAYESKGVILGRLGEYQKAIDVMNELLQVDPQSIMAHTNKSLYLMKLGKIEEAEAEKDKATVKSFKKASEDAKLKKQQDEEIIRREGMFQQVLEIDPDDLLANFGMADIAFRRKDYESTLTLTKKVIKNHPQHSQAYLLNGKALIELKKPEEAKEILALGIEKAKKKGELMPAQEMSLLLGSLK